MKKYLLITVCILQLSHAVRADEGMWLPILLGQGPEAEMKRLGMKISAEDIFSMNKPSLKDAIVLFGGGCTAEIISDQGLILTNHHCGYSAIQAHSSLEHDYLTDGFWAQSLAEELPNPNLRVSLLVRMEDVTGQVLQGVNDDMDPAKRQALIDLKIAGIKKAASQNNRYEAEVKPFYYGNQYILVVYEVFKDVRMVGAPPSSIGKFGGDTDNWMWPRHTGDFSLFRIYVNKDNEPAAYSKDNVPYTPKYTISVSLKGVQPGDFTFVYGYPGTTQEYLTSQAVDRIANYENPASISMRGMRLAIYRKYMENDRRIRIMYAAKYAGVENFYKKMIGESRGVQSTGIIQRKKEMEKAFAVWANATPERSALYGTLMSDFEKVYAELGPYNLASEYLFEGGLGIEFVRYANGYEKLVSMSEGKKENTPEITSYLEKMQAYIPSFFKNYDPRIDKEVMEALLEVYYRGLPKEFIPDEILKAGVAGKGDFTNYASRIFSKSVLLNPEKAAALLKNFKPSSAKTISNDPAYIFARSLYGFYFNKLSPKTSVLQAKLDAMYALYIRGLMEMQPDRRFYPDANSTLRVAYGQVKEYEPRDGVIYKHFTTLGGIIQKEDTAVYDYKVDPRLKNLYALSDYGRYADTDGSLHVAFIATNHTTGGNSGSPVFNARGELIGVNFDRVWEGTMSDIVYDPKICRNIALDIRYCLFVIDKMAGCKRLVDEIKIAE